MQAVLSYIEGKSEQAPQGQQPGIIIIILYYTSYSQGKLQSQRIRFILIPGIVLILCLHHLVHACIPVCLGPKWKPHLLLN